MAQDAHALLQYNRRPSRAASQPQPLSQQHHHQQQQQYTPPTPFQQRQQQRTMSASLYDVRWETGALGLRFTPDENDDAVVCQVMETASDDVKRSRVAVGDVVVAVQIHAIGAPMAPVASLHEMAQIFQHEDLPITVRFRTRAHESPQSIEVVDIARSFTYSWPPGQPLGVSLAMDPCSLHTIITAVDHDRISPEFLALEPAPGDILISVRDPEKKADLDSLRFEKAIETLKTFPRPCKLTFARLHEEVTSPSEVPPPQGYTDRARSASSGPRSAPHPVDQSAYQPPRSPAHAQGVPPAPFSAPPGAQPMRRPAPLMKRQSFAVDKTKQPVLSEEEARKKAQRDARFYKIMYSGGQVGLVLKDAKLDLKGKPKKNGYYVYIKKIPNKRAHEGLDQAAEGDELIAIGTHDLQHMAFEDVQRELMAVRSPTPLVFQHRPAGNVSVGASLVDGLLLFLI